RTGQPGMCDVRRAHVDHIRADFPQELVDIGSGALGTGRLGRYPTPGGGGSDCRCDSRSRPPRGLGVRRADHPATEHGRPQAPARFVGEPSATHAGTLHAEPAVNSCYAGSASEPGRDFLHYPNGPTGNTVFLNVAFVTPANAVYQAATAVAMPT